MKDINPGIRRTVSLLQVWGFETTDSGDGRTHDHECDRDVPYVSMVVNPMRSLVEEAARLRRCLLSLCGVRVSPVGQGPVWIQASYDPATRTAIIDLQGVDDELLRTAADGSGS